MDIDEGASAKKQPEREQPVNDPNFDESAVFTGKVKYFRTSGTLKITPDTNLKEAFGLEKEKATVEASCSDLYSGESPCILDVDQQVEFKLRKDQFGIYAYFVSGQGGNPLVNKAGAVDKSKQKDTPARTTVNNGQYYEGTVDFFKWQVGFGKIAFSNPDAFVVPEIKPEKEAKSFEKTKKLWFHRDDVQSNDPAIGVENKTAVRFQVYTDSKGIGAFNITQADGSPFSGQRFNLFRGKRRVKKKKKQQQQQKKRKFGQMGNMPMMMMPMNMGGNQMMMPMMMGGGGFGGGQVVMMNGQPFFMQGGGKKKKRKKNKNKKKKTRTG